MVIRWTVGMSGLVHGRVISTRLRCSLVVGVGQTGLAERRTVREVWRASVGVQPGHQISLQPPAPSTETCSS